MNKEAIDKLWLKLQNTKTYDEVYKLLDGAINSKGFCYTTLTIQAVKVIVAHIRSFLKHSQSSN